MTIIWKSFKFADLFILDGTYNTKTSNKNLDIRDVMDLDHSLLLINKGGTNNAKEGYINKNSGYKTCPNGITMDDQFGNCFYHDREFIMTGGGHINVVLFKNDKLKSLADNNKIIYYFISTILRKIFQKTSIYGYTYKITNERPFRELILLPVIEIKSNEDYIWEQNGTFWTLDVDYINHLMLEAKKRKEEKTIKLYEAEKAKYEAEKAKYEAEKAKYEAAYLEEQDALVWKSFKLGDLFNRNSSHSIKTAKKNLDESSVFDEFHTIKNITASKENNGCSGYLADEGEVSERKKKNMLTIASDAAYGGVCFFQNDEFVTTGHNNILEIKNSSFKDVLDKNTYLYMYLSKMITKVIKIDGVNRFMRPIGSDFDRELIFIPVLEVNTNEEYIWNENKKHWTLAKNTASYLYLQGQIKIQQRKIEFYRHPY